MLAYLTMTLEEIANPNFRAPTTATSSSGSPRDSFSRSPRFSKDGVCAFALS